MKRIKPYLLFIAVALADAVLFVHSPDTAIQVLKNTRANFLHMLGVIPPIFLLIGLLDVWVPRETVIKHMGNESGIKGVLLSIFLGSAAAGPLYAAFPIASIMMKKGVKFSNILVFLGAWSTTKIPMFLFEMASLGQRFAVTRLVLSLLGILVMAWIIDRLMSQEEKEDIYIRQKGEV